MYDKPTANVFFEDIIMAGEFMKNESNRRKIYTQGGGGTNNVR
jgi:hypothetical protein